MLQVEAFSLSLTEKIKEQNKSTKETRVPYLPSRKLGDIEAATQIMVDEGDSLVTDFMSSGGVWVVGCGVCGGTYVVVPRTEVFGL